MATWTDGIQAGEGPDERRARSVEREAATDAAVRREATLEELDERDVRLADAVRSTIRRQRYEAAVVDAREKQAESIRVALRYGLTVRDIANETGLHPNAVQRIAREA